MPRVKEPVGEALREISLDHPPADGVDGDDAVPCADKCDNVAHKNYGTLAPQRFGLACDGDL